MSAICLPRPRLVNVMFDTANGRSLQISVDTFVWEGNSINPAATQSTFTAQNEATELLDTLYVLVSMPRIMRGMVE